jgi:hypothetical protein
MEKPSVSQDTRFLAQYHNCEIKKPSVSQDTRFLVPVPQLNAYVSEGLGVLDYLRTP